MTPEVLLEDPPEVRTLIYFVCHGNTCRSPMATDILRQLLRRRGVSSVQVDCFGTNPYYPDNPAVKELREKAVLEVMGDLDGLPEHKPKGLRDVRVAPSDLVVMLAPDSVETLREQLSSLKEPPRPLLWDIPDPFTRPFQAYVDTARTLKDRIERNFNLFVRGSP